MKVSKIFCILLGILMTIFGVWMIGYIFNSNFNIFYLLIFVAVTIFGFLFSLVNIVAGLVDIKSKKSSDSTTSETGTIHSYVSYSEAPVQKPKKCDVIVPDRIDDLYLVYQYGKIKFLPSENAQSVALEMQRNNNWDLNVVPDADKLKLMWNDQVIGTLIDRVDMVQDWLILDNLLKVWLENIGDSGNFVRLAFYRDELKRLSDRETTVVKLTKSLNEEAQFAMSGLSDGVKLDFDDKYEFDAPDQTVWITYGSALGTLPKKIAQRYLNEGASAVFLDHLDYDLEKEKDVPYVKIYW